MGLMGIFDIGKSALIASQTQLNVTSNNIANANTPGYSRQEVILEISTPVAQSGGVVGSGVTVAQIKRHYDALIQNQIIGIQQDYGKAYILNQTLAGVEPFFNEVQNSGLAGPLRDFFKAWQDVASNPDGLTERNALLQKSDALVLSAQGIEQGLIGNLKNTEQGITDLTSQINSLASKLARLNDQIIQAGNGSAADTANQLKDQRDGLLKDLSNLVEVSSWEDKNSGTLTVTIGMKNLVSGNRANILSAVYNQEGNYNLLLDGQDITSRITKGEMGGFLAARQDIKGNLLEFRKLIASITNTVNLQHVQGFGLDGSTNNNFFDPVELTVKDFSAGADLTAALTDYSQLTMSEYSIKFNGGNYEVYNKETGTLLTSGVYNAGGTTINLEGIQFDINGSVTDQDSFSVSPLTTAVSNFKTALTSAQQIAVSGSASGLPGDNTNALAMAGLMDRNISALHSDTFANYYKNLVAKVGYQGQAASDELKFADNLLSQLNIQRDSVSGVNLDEEASNLIIFQRAYQAAARLITTADELYKTLLNL
jgi:flagellar hook-associated protein 1